jgi:hypothetical protein
MRASLDFGDTSASAEANGAYLMTVRSLHLASTIALVGCLLLFSGAPTRAADPEPVATSPATPAAAPAALATPAPAADTAAVELPRFRSGLWEYRRTLMRGGKPQVSTTRKCADPGADMREKMAQLKKKNCQFAPLRRSNEHYISSWTCQTPTGAMRFRDVLTATDDSSYQDVSETHTAQHISQQKLEARRVGECPGLGAGAPLPPTKLPPRHP